MTDRYTHIGLYDERAALDSPPELPSLGGNRSDENKTAALKTGTDDVSVGIDKSAYKPAYKKLAKNAYSDSDRSSTIDTDRLANKEPDSENGPCDNLVQGGRLDNACHAVTTKERRGRDSNPRNRLLPVRRFSKPLPSATRPPLQTVNEQFTSPGGLLQQDK